MDNDVNNDVNRQATEIEDVTYGPQYTTSMSTTTDWEGDVPRKYASLFDGYEHYTPGGPVPSGWTVQDNLSLTWVSIQNLPWLMPGMLSAPYCHMTDGCIDVSYATTEGFSRISYLKMLTQAGDGTFVDNPKFSYLKVRSLTMEPYDEMGYIGVDGERIPFAPVSIHVVQGMINFISYA